MLTLIRVRRAIKWQRSKGFRFAEIKWWAEDIFFGSLGNPLPGQSVGNVFCSLRVPYIKQIQAMCDERIHPTCPMWGWLKWGLQIDTQSTLPPAKQSFWRYAANHFFRKTDCRIGSSGMQTMKLSGMTKASNIFQRLERGTDCASICLYIRYVYVHIIVYIYIYTIYIYTICM